MIDTIDAIGHPAALKREAKEDVVSLEVQLLLEAILRRYGYDFRSYAFSSLKRRILHLVKSLGMETVSALQEKVLHDPSILDRLLLAISVNVTSLFRDPEFFAAVRERVVPILKTYPFVRIWHAGCSTGEEVYSMAILLEEEGLYDRCRIYATDMNEGVLRRAREGIFPLSTESLYRQNYQHAGGKASLDDYFTAAYGSGIFRAALKRNVVFSQHNLATDGSFNEFHLIMCRNVLIYFKKSLQSRVHSLLYESLNLRGILGLGSKESIQFTPHEKGYETLKPGVKLYRRVQ
jgi:chemotaxis protein methyltransferase CheR